MTATVSVLSSSWITGPLMMSTGKKNTARKKPRPRNLPLSSSASNSATTTIIGVLSSTNFMVSSSERVKVVSSVKASLYH